MKFRLRRKQLCFKQAVIMAQWFPNSIAVPAPSIPSSQFGEGHLDLPPWAQGSHFCCDLEKVLQMSEVPSPPRSVSESEAEVLQTSRDAMVVQGLGAGLGHIYKGGGPQ